MTTNSVYSSKLLTLKENLESLQSKINASESYAKKLQSEVAAKDKKHRQAKTIVTLSFLLSIAVIVAGIFLFYPYLLSVLTSGGQENINSTAILACVVFSGIALHLINYILRSVLEGYFDFLNIIVLLACGLPFISCIASVVWIIGIIKEGIERKENVNSTYSSIRSNQHQLTRLNKQKGDLQQQIAQTEQKIRQAELLYQKALESGDENIMHQAANEGYDAAIAYLENKEKERKQLEGKELYDNAMSADPVDEDLMEEAVDLDYAPACLYFGRKLFVDLTSDMLTSSEKQSLAEDIVAYLENVVEDDLEAEFLWLSARIISGNSSDMDWEDMLSRARAIKKSKKLPDHYASSLDTLIKLLVQAIDEDDEPVYKNTSRKEQHVRFSCSFNANGICTRKSSSFSVAQCYYVSNPYMCSDAKAFGGLQSEIY